MTNRQQVDVLDYQPPTRRSKRPFWPAPPGILFNLWVVLLSGASLWTWRVPHGTFLLGPLLALFWSVTGVLWMSKFFPHLRALCARGGSRRRRLAILPLVLMTVTGALVATDVPRRVAFALSKPALLSLVENQTGRYVGRAGVYRVRMRPDDRGGVIFVTNTIGIFSEAGYAHFPNGAPGPASGLAETFIPLGDGWYIYRFVD